MHRTLPQMLDELLTSTENSLDVCASWSQGRAAYGGLVAAIATTVMEKSLSQQKPLQSLMVNFVAPLPAGLTHAKSTILRDGRSVTQLAADVLSGDQVAAHASAAFGFPREALSIPPSAGFNPRPRSNVPALDSSAPMLPGFMANFDIHWTGGGIPMSNMKDRTLSMWVRHRDTMDHHPVAKIVAIADMPPPIILSHYNKRPIASSLSWSMEFMQPAESIRSDWFYLEFDLDTADSGYTRQSGRIFDESGTLCALTRQCMVYFE